MTAKVLESFGGKFAEQWVATLLTPAFAFWLGGFVALVQRWGWSFFVTAFTRQPEPLQLAMLAGGLGMIATSAFVVQRFDLATLRFLEGYWYPWLRPLRQRRIQHYRHRRDQLSEQRQKLRADEDQNEAIYKTLKAQIESEGAAKLSPDERNQYLQLHAQHLTPAQ